MTRPGPDASLLRICAMLALFGALSACGEDAPPEPALPEAAAKASPALETLLVKSRTMPPLEADDAVRMLALEDDTVIPALITALRTPEATKPQLRAAFGAITAIGPPVLGPVLELFVAADGETARRAYKAASHLIPSASQWRDADDPFGRKWTLEDAHAVRIYETRLVDRLEDRDGDVRRYALLILAALPPTARTELAVTPLLDALESDDAVLQAEGAYALMVSGAAARDAVPRLMAQLDQKDEVARDFSLSILTRLGHDVPEVGQALLKRLGGVTSGEERTSLACALAEMGENARPALPWFEGELTSGKPDRARTALNCLQRMGTVAGPLLVGVLDGNDAAAQALAAEGLGRLGAAAPLEAVQALETAAASSDAALAEAAKAALARIRAAQSDQ